MAAGAGSTPGARQVSPPAPQNTGPLYPIQVIPPGLTGLLQLKQLGRLPDKLADTVAGVVELRDWYLTARRLTETALFGSIPVSNTIAGGTVGGVSFLAGGVPAAVPQNQIWYCEQMTVSVLPTGAEVATDLLRYACAIVGQPTANSAFQQVSPDVADNALAARTRKIMAHADRGFWAFPGDLFQIQIFDNLSTNGWTASLSLRATPCPI